MTTEELAEWVLEGRTICVIVRAAHRSVAMEDLCAKLAAGDPVMKRSEGVVRCLKATFRFVTPENLDIVRGYRFDGVILWGDVPRPESPGMCSLLRFARGREDVKTMEW